MAFKVHKDDVNEQMELILGGLKELDRGVEIND